MKKKHSLIKRLAAVFCAVLLLVPCLSIYASAASLEGSATFPAQFRVTNYYNTYFPDRSSVGSGVTFPTFSDTCLQSYQSTSTVPVLVWPGSLTLGGGNAFSSTTGIYLSFYFAGSLSGHTLHRDLNLTKDHISLDFTNHDGTTDSVGVVLSKYTPTALYAATTGYSIAAHVNATYRQPASQLSLTFNQLDVTDSAVFSAGSAAYSGFSLYVSSASLVSVASEQELYALEEIANTLLVQNSILAGLYGDLMSILGNLYSRTGDILATEELANTYLLGILDYLSHLNVTTDCIYDLLSLYLHYLDTIALMAEELNYELAAFHDDFIDMLGLLISTVSAESGNIQDKMEELYALLIAYLDNTFAGAVDSGAQDAINSANSAQANTNSVESQWTGSLGGSFADLQLDSYSFPTSFLGGFVWVSSWFSNIFNSFGDYGQVIIFPLLLGVVMLLVGMISRTARRKGG